MKAQEVHGGMGGAGGRGNRGPDTRHTAAGLGLWEEQGGTWPGH